MQTGIWPPAGGYFQGVREWKRENNSLASSRAFVNTWRHNPASIEQDELHRFIGYINLRDEFL
jgi:hypothetical protein